MLSVRNAVTKKIGDQLSRITLEGINSFIWFTVLFCLLKRLYVYSTAASKWF